MYLGWYDPDRKKTSAQKLADASARYRRKWGRDARVAIVNAADSVDIDGIEVRVAAHVPPNTFFVGEDEEVSEELLAA